MKIKQLSDLHLEFPHSEIELTRDGADVLILGGDICVAAKMDKFVPFFERAAAIFPHVIYIAGNHEYYRDRWEDTYDHMRMSLAHLPNIHVSDGSSFKIDGVWFWAGTLWTDCNRMDHNTMEYLRHEMNDYRLIEKSGGRLWPNDTVKEHLAQRTGLEVFLNGIDGKSGIGDEPCVVCTHMAPSKLSTHPRYKTDFHMNGGYSSDLHELIEANPNIKLWTHGHTHDSFDYTVGKTRIVANPAGYPMRGRDGKIYRENVNFDPKLVIEV